MMWITSKNLLKSSLPEQQPNQKILSKPIHSYSQLSAHRQKARQTYKHTDPKNHTITSSVRDN